MMCNQLMMNHLKPIQIDLSDRSTCPECQPFPPSAEANFAMEPEAGWCHSSNHELSGYSVVRHTTAQERGLAGGQPEGRLTVVGTEPTARDEKSSAGQLASRQSCN